jgi:hypothetical protein
MANVQCLPPSKAYQFSPSTQSPFIYENTFDSTDVGVASKQECQDLQPSEVYHHINELYLIYEREATQSNNTPSSADTSNIDYDGAQYELQRWAYETSNLTPAEILLNSNWEDQPDGSQDPNRNVAITQQFDDPPWVAGQRRQKL